MYTTTYRIQNKKSEEGSDSESNNTDMPNEQVASMSSGYWGCCTPRRNYEILARRAIFAEGKRGNEGSREHDNHHKNATAPLLQKTFDVKHLVPTNQEGDYYSNKYEDIQS